MDGYLDIETTGLNPYTDRITVVGIYRDCTDGIRMRQLVGMDITRESVAEVLQGVTVLHTYNGIKFDLRFLEAQLGITLPATMTHRDLMHDCWKRNLYGGLKAVESRLGIQRTTEGVTGREAVALWWRYIDAADIEALELLLAYNREDVENLLKLKERFDAEEPLCAKESPARD